MSMSEERPSPRKRPLLSWWVWVLVGLALAVVLMAVVMPAFAKRREKPHAASCHSNLKQIALAASMYALDHDGTFVRLRGWDHALGAYWKNPKVFHCPQDEREDVLSYAINLRVSGLRIPTVPSENGKSPDLVFPDDAATTVTFCDGEGLEVIERHQEGANYAFLDSHVKWLADPPEGSGLSVWEE